MCRFSIKLLNSPSTAGYGDFAKQPKELTDTGLTTGQLDEIGRNIKGIERLINARRGLAKKDDTLPERWFEEEIKAGPFAGEKIDRAPFKELKSLFYTLTGLNRAGVPSFEWHRNLAGVINWFAVKVTLPHGVSGAPEGAVISTTVV